MLYILHMTVSVICKLILLALTCLIALRSAQEFVPGQCQNVTIKQNFDIPQYLGLWYEYQRYFAAFEANGKCVTATYGENPNGTVSVSNYLVNANTNEPETILGWAELEDSSTGEGKLWVHFPNETAGAYWVLDTDYTSYSVVWSCAEVATDRTVQFSWLLTRERFPSAQTLAEAQRVIDVNQLAPQYIITDHQNCP